MAGRSLKPQLNLIRSWVHQGRTDAWIAHQLEVTTAELREFKRRHGLVPGEEGANGERGLEEVDLRDEIEAEVEAAQEAAEEEEEEEEEEAGEEEVEEEAGEEAWEEAEEEEAPPAGRAAGRGERRPRETGGRGERRPRETTGERRPEEAGERRPRRRGGRGRGRRREAALYEATFDHGEKEGYGLWLDPAVGDDPVYTEHWAGHRPVRVTIEAERIVIERAREGR